MIAKGYEIRDAEISENAHKYIAFRAPGQERWIRGRAKSLGAEYTRERIKDRIEEKARIRAERMKKLISRPASMIDTSENRFTESPGLRKWAERQNLKAAAKMQSELAGMGFSSLSEVNEKIETLHLQAKTGKKATVDLDRRKKTASEILHFARQYEENRRYEKGYEKSKDKERYYRTHRTGIHLAWGARERLRNTGVDLDSLNLSKLEAEYTRIVSDRENTSAAYKSAEAECEKLKKIRDDLYAYIGGEPSQNIALGHEQKQTL